MTKTGCHFCAAIDTGELPVFFVTAQFQCFFDNRREILLLVNMNSTRESNYFCCKYSVCIAVFGRHQAVCGVEDRSGKMIKFPLLILPCGSEMSFQVRELF